MSFQVVFTPLAAEDYLEGIRWYKEQQDELDVRFDEAINATLDHISNYPSAYALRKKSIRAAVVQAFPYVIFFKLEVQRKRVVILAILHQARDPKVWQKRK
jgi:toxin ParE1/3/4